jgi:nucleoside-diphosphate-sugar epimerase
MSPASQERDPVPVEPDAALIGPDDLILITGATGFIGSRVIQILLERGFRHLRCFARPSSDLTALEALAGGHRGARIEVVQGNLLSRQDCSAAAQKVAVIFHLAMGGSKSFPDAFMNSVITTRNLLDASLGATSLRRFVNVSSFAVYANREKPRWRLLDESCRMEGRPELRGEAYCFAKVRQDELVTEYGRRFGIPYVLVRPGYVYGPGRAEISTRVGVGTFGVFLHLGGSNPLPLTYVDNCAEAIVLAGLRKGVDGQVFNVVDDDLPSSRRFLRLYKRHVRRFTSIGVPHVVSYAACWLWELYSKWADEQLPPVFNRRRWHAYWKKTRYSNHRTKAQLGWRPRVSMEEGLRRYFASCRERAHHA